MKTRLLAIEQKTKEIRAQLSPKAPEAKEYLERFEMAWIRHDCALEGIIYNVSELTAALSQTPLAPDVSIFPAIWEIRNHKAAVDYVRQEAKTAKRNAPLTLPFVKQINELLSGATPKAQELRTQMERRDRTEKELNKEKELLSFRKDIPLHKTYLHDLSPPGKVASATEKLLTWTGSAEFRELHPIIQAAKVQHQFIQIFPFPQTSGKLGRLLSNYVALRNGYFPIIIASVDRSKYFESFRASFTTFLNLLLDAMENSLENGLKYFRDQARAFR